MTVAGSSDPKVCSHDVERLRNLGWYHCPNCGEYIGEHRGISRGGQHCTDNDCRCHGYPLVKRQDHIPPGTKPTLSSNPLGAVACPICGKAESHQHPVSAIRWVADHKRAFFDAAEAQWPIGASHEFHAEGDGIRFYHPESQKLWTLYCSVIERQMSKRLAPETSDGPQPGDRYHPIAETTIAHWLGELLAVIHRDGGQYEGKHGSIVATQDAIKIVHVLRGDRNCKVCDGLGYSVGVSKRIPCDECDGTGLELFAEHARPAQKANACQCDPNPSIGGSPPCPVHDGENEDAV